MHRKHVINQAQNMLMPEKKQFSTHPVLGYVLKISRQQWGLEPPPRAGHVACAVAGGHASSSPSSARRPTGAHIEFNTRMTDDHTHTKQRTPKHRSK